MYTTSKGTACDAYSLIKEIHFKKSYDKTTRIATSLTFEPEVHVITSNLVNKMHNSKIQDSHDNNEAYSCFASRGSRVWTTPLVTQIIRTASATILFLVPLPLNQFVIARTRAASPEMFLAGITSFHHIAVVIARSTINLLQSFNGVLRAIVAIRGITCVARCSRTYIKRLI